jgi:peptidoglycan hydrolase-like protein with peptidoglycan-binding domain
MRRTRTRARAAVVTTLAMAVTTVAGAASAYAALELLADRDTADAAAVERRVVLRPSTAPADGRTGTGDNGGNHGPDRGPDRGADREDAPRRSPEPDPGGPVLLAPGDRGAEVRELQARLRQIAWFFGDVTDLYGDQTETAVAGFQAKRGFPSTGVVDQRTMTRLEEMTTEPTVDELANVAPDPADGAALDPRCLTGRALCVDKSSSSLRWVVDGEVQLSVDARFGGNGYVTREGAFTVYRKSRDHVSSLYDTSMPFAMFFDGGQAVHYSPDFAANGYGGASHGCVNIRDYEEIAALYDEVQLGDKVVVYWS